MASLEELRERFAVHKAALDRWTEWVPHKPHPRQREFLDLDVLEAGYGGAAGGGKSDALLMGALQYADTPGYAALILRRTFADLSLPGAIMDRSTDWLRQTRASWNENDHRWTFPSGAALQFGYCQTKTDLSRYKSAEFQFIAVDEATEWPEAWYTFLFSRLRRRKGVEVPLRMRSGTNPDGPGYGWYRERFGIPENTEIHAPIWNGDNRVFMPARAEDNPELDLAAYELSLAEMTGGRSGVAWKQLRTGLWIPSGAGLVYVFDKAKNAAAVSKMERFSGKWSVVLGTPRERWSFVLGIDYGFTNACGFVVLGWREGDPTVYILEAFTVENLEPSAAALVVKGLEKEYEFSKMVGDVGGLGKGYAEEGRKRFTLPIEPAAKQNKRGYQKLFNGALSDGHVKVVVDKCQDLLAEWKALPWRPDRKDEMAGFANHASDAALYAWRECPNYHERTEEPPPPPGTAEALVREEQRYEEVVDEELDADEEAERVTRKAWWR